MNDGDFKDEIELIRALHREDRRAYEQLFAEFRNELTYYAVRLTNDMNVSEELVSDSFIKLFSRITAFPSKANIKSFLYITTRNACYDYLDQEKRKSRNYFDFLYLNLESDKEQTPVEFERINAELIDALHKEISKLPELSRRVITLRIFEQLEPSKVAEVLGISYQTVKNQTYIATSRLKNSVSLLKKLSAEMMILIISCLHVL